jgi:uncharacterized delta-60 repeat protein
MVYKHARAGLLIGLASLISIGFAQPAFAQPAANTAGGLDPTFGVGGQVLTNLGDTSGGFPINVVPGNAALQPNGDIVIGGSFGLVRYLPNGTLDTSFGTGGLLQTGFTATDDPAYVALQSNGDIVWAGTTTTSSGTTAFAVARYTLSGALDPAFGDGGMVVTPFPAAPDGAETDTVLVEPDGDILVGGDAGVPGTTRNEPVIEDGALALYNPNGTLDTSFGTGGLVMSTSSVGNVTNVGVDASGDVFVLPADAEFSPAGQLDSTVTPEAITASSQDGTETFLSSGQYISAGTVSVGRDQTDVQVQEFNAGGSLDPAFTSPPFTFTGAEFAGHQGPGAVAITPSGQIAVVGSDFEGTSLFGVARLNASGSLDGTFGNAGVVTTDFQGDDIGAVTLVQPNGDIIAIGISEDNATGVVDLALARYLG